MVAAPKEFAILQCYLCRSQIGLFRPEDLRVPLDASMFKSIDEFHGFPPPFTTQTDGRGNYVTWEHAVCPYCRNRPFELPNKVQTPYGVVMVGNTDIPRPKTMEDANQKLINKEWEKEEESALSAEERNQKIIESFDDEPVAIKPKAEVDALRNIRDFVENHIITEEDVKGIKEVKPQTDDTGSFVADKAAVKNRCKFCGKGPYSHQSSRSRHEVKCPDNPKNKKKGKKK